jgi:uncharacterized membrane protein YdbT with pleckstrin-like domain
MIVMDSKKSSRKAKVKYFDEQFDDEKVLFIFRKHPVVMRKGLIFGLLGPLIGVIPTAIDPGLGFGFFFGGLFLGVILGLLILMPSWIGWYFSLFIVTNQRFVQTIQKGFFHHSMSSIKLEQIQTISYELSGMQETLLGFGSLKVQTFFGDLVIHDVHHPGKIQQKMQNILRSLDIIVDRELADTKTMDQNEE